MQGFITSAKCVSVVHNDHCKHVYVPHQEIVNKKVDFWSKFQSHFVLGQEKSQQGLMSITTERQILVMKLSSQ